MKPDDLIEGGLIRDSDLDGEPVHETSELGPLGRYVLLEEIGRGGAAVVYRALDPLLNRELALKRLRFGDPELEARFLREAELLARLSHSGIVPVFDFGREGDSHYYTMPLAAGLSLDRWILDHRPGALEAARIVRQAAEALAHAHERGVLHRDVKPANILVNAEGAALLADFGLGRFEGPDAGDEGRVTQSGEVMGTPSYMAPELATRDLKSADARCDVYSMGATLYETLTGRPPFIGRSSLEILKRATAEEPVSPRKLAPDTPLDLEIVCLRALEKDPARRYATVREFADDLGRFLAGDPIRARGAGPLYRLKRFVGRRRAVVGVALAGLLIAAGIGSFALLREESAEARRSRITDLVHEIRRQHGIMEGALTRVGETNPEVVLPAQVALGLIEQALQIEPDHGESHYLRGMNHALRFDSKTARLHYESAILGGFARARLERTILDCQDLIVQFPQSRPPGGPSASPERRRAISAELESILHSSTLPEHEFARGLLAFLAAEYLKAAALFRSYTGHTSDWRAFYWLGLSESELARTMEPRSAERTRCLESSLEALDRAFKRRPACVVTSGIVAQVGMTQAPLGRVADSIDSLRRAVALDAGNPRYRYNLASVLLAGAKNHVEAILEVEKGMELQKDPDSVPGEAHAIRGLAYSRRDDRPGLEAAEFSLKAALRLLPKGDGRIVLLQNALQSVTERLSPEKPGRSY